MADFDLLAGVIRLVQIGTDQLFAVLAQTGNRVSRLPDDEPDPEHKTTYTRAMCVVAAGKPAAALPTGSRALEVAVRDLAQSLMADAPKLSERTGTMWVGAVRFKFEAEHGDSMRMRICVDVGPTRE